MLICKCGGLIRHHALAETHEAWTCESCGHCEIAQRDTSVALGPLEIWTDGSVFPNPGNGGWGYVRSDGQEACGGVANTTNNRMELTAILRALESLEAGATATIYSDSQYCVNGLTTWHAKWKRGGWKRKGIEIPNRDLWILLDAAGRQVQAKFKWVRGHNGNPGNERADRLADKGRVMRIEVSAAA